MRIWKLHALGNHFVFALHDDWLDYPELARALCRTGLSIGGDGLLSVDVAASPPMVRMWNPDGTEDFCGNGLCCAAHLLHFLRGTDPTMLQTPLAPVPVSIEALGDDVAQVTIHIRHPSFDAEAIPLITAHGIADEKGVSIEVDDRSFRVIPVNNGNIHSVVFVDELPDDAFFHRYSPGIETHRLFPNKTNVLWTRVGAATIELRIWERSVGETLSCGTGAAAAAAICRFAGYALPPSVEVVMPGGSAQVSLTPTGVELSTRATLVFEGQLPETDLGIQRSRRNKAIAVAAAPAM
jgi:diaminopimelate epimerase